MNNISSINTNLPALPARSAAPAANENAVSINTADNVELSTGKKAGKALLGTAMSVVAAPATAMIKGFRGAVEAADRGLGIEGKQTGIAKNLQKLAIGAGAAFGMVAGGAMGPAGAIAGAIMGPGIVGGLVSGGKGVLEGGKMGMKVTGKIAGKIDKMVAGKLGSLAGKAAKIASAVALGAIALPACAAFKGIDKGIDFARKAVGIIKTPQTTGEAMMDLGKEGAVIYGMISGTIASAPGLVSALSGGIATAGGIGTAITGVTEGVKGFKDGINASFDLADKIVRG